VLELRHSLVGGARVRHRRRRLPGASRRRSSPGTPSTWASRPRAGGIEADEKVEVLDGIGRFGWAVDPEGNRFELWEPTAS